VLWLSATTRVDTPCGKAYITICKTEAGVLDHVLVQLGKAGGCASAQLSILSTSINTMLEEGVPREVITKLLQEWRGVSCFQGQDSCVHLIAALILSELERDPGEEIPAC
jgi:ribonucleoside-diphosphate reductase alpha chain